MLLRNEKINRNFPYKDMALEFFKLVNGKEESKKTEVLENIEEDSNYRNCLKNGDEKLKNDWEKLMNLINNSKDNIETQRKMDNITFSRTEDNERGQKICQK